MTWVARIVDRVPKGAKEVHFDSFEDLVATIGWLPIDNVKVYETEKCYYAEGFLPGRVTVTVYQIRK